MASGQRVACMLLPTGLFVTGRIGVLSAGAVDDEFFGQRDSWSRFAARCEQARCLSARDARHVDTMAAFSQPIGKNDPHFENISLLIDEDGEYQGIAPAYEILPMRYASIGSGVDPDLTPIEPRLGTMGAQPAVRAQAAGAAKIFWRSVPSDRLAAPVSDAMRHLPAENLAVAGKVVGPLLSAARVEQPRRQHQGICTHQAPT